MEKHTLAAQQKERLKFMLAQDRRSLSPAMMEMLKKDIAEVFSKHLRVDAEVVENAIEIKIVEDIGEEVSAISANVAFDHVFHKE